MRDRSALLLRAALVAVLSVVFIASSCSREEVDESPFLDLVDAGEDAPTVLLVGDSISFVSYLELTSAFSTAGWSHAISGEIGSTTEDNRAKIRGAIERDPDVVVVELGTNDAGDVDRQGSIDGVREQIQDAMNDLQVVPCVVWVDINTWTTSGISDFRDLGPRINELIRSEASNYPNIGVADYDAFFKPSNDEKSTFLTNNFDDELMHPVSPESKSAYAAIVVDAVAASCGI